MSRSILIIIALISGNYIYAQQINCKVLMPEISGTYSGGCKRGLAHGQGVAQGNDWYEGQFVKGLPDGNGTYRWADGPYYEGQWNRGMKEGKGKMVYADSILSGYWKQDRYVGEKLVPPYVIKYSLSVARSSITKSIGSMDAIRIRLLQGGSDNGSVSDLSIVSSSGDQYRTGVVYGIQNIQFPVYVKVQIPDLEPAANNTIQCNV